MEEARVEVEDDLEKLKLGVERSDSFEIRDSDAFRARASIDVFLVWEGERLGIAGALSIVLACVGTMKYDDKWFFWIS